MKTPDKRLLDKLAGKGSVAGKLKEQREKMERGESMHPTVPATPDNSPDEVIRRGYIRNEE